MNRMQSHCSIRRSCDNVHAEVIFKYKMTETNLVLVHPLQIRSAHFAITYCI